MTSPVITPPYTQQPPEDNHQKIISNLTKIYNQPLQLNMTSTETGSCTASLLNSVHGEANGNSRLDKASIIHQLESKTDNNLLKTLRDILVVGPGKHSDCRKYGVSIEYTIHNLSKDDKDILSKFSDLMFYSPLNHHHHMIFDTYRGGGDESITWLSNITTKENLDTFMKSLDAMFNKSKYEHKFVLSVIAYRLIEEFKVNTPEPLMNEDLTPYKSQYPKLFNTGEIIHNHLTSG